MKYIYIINGRADKLPQYQELHDQLKEIPHPHELYTTLGEGDATRFVYLYSDLHPGEEVCFVACGGLGITNEVASGLVGFNQVAKPSGNKANKTMAILDFGGNTGDFLINYPDRDFRSVKEMLEGSVSNIDILKVNDSYCVNVCNIGFNSKVASRANELMSQGKSAHEAFTRGVVNAILTSRYNRIKVTVDGKRIAPGYMILCTLANGQRVGGEFYTAPYAKLDDGLIEVCYFRAMSLLRFLQLIPLYRKGEHIGSRVGKNKILYRQAHEVTVTSKDLIDVYLDGEQLPGSKFEIKILAGALPLRLPQIVKNNN